MPGRQKRKAEEPEQQQQEESKRQRQEEQDQEEEEDGQGDPIPISRLLEEDNKIKPAEINKLMNEGFRTVESIAFATIKRLSKIESLGEQKVKRLKEAASKLCPLGLISAREYHEYRKQTRYLSTGSKELDKLLLKGIETGTITEIFGEFSTGKTQLCHTLCVTCQLPYDQGGGEGKALYIDTEGTFRPERIEQIAQRYDLDPEHVLENVAYGRAYNSEHQTDLLVQAAAMMAEDRFALIVVDSATALFRTDFVGRSELSERQQKLGQFLRALTNLADEFGVAVVVTNQVTADPQSVGSYQPTVKPIGGNIMAHASTTRLKLTVKSKGNRGMKVVDSPCLPAGEALFGIFDDGINDARE